MKKVLNYVLFSFFVFILLSLNLPNISAIAIGPGKIEIIFSPGLSQKLDFVVQSNSAGTRGFDIYIKDITDGGELVKYIQCDQSTLKLKTGEWAGFSCNITLPNYMMPGPHEVRVGFREQPVSTASTISVLTGVESRIIINVAYDGFYPKLGISVNNTKRNENVNFIVTVKNWGNKGGTASADIDIYSSSWEKVGSTKTDSKFIDSMQSDSLYANWLANVEPGKYTAIAKTFVDGININASTQFLVGDLLLNILNLNSDITADEIGKFETTIESLWPEQINFDLNIEVFDINGKSMGSRKDSFVINSWGTKTFTTIWDNKIPTAGNYTANVSAIYNGKITSKIFEFSVKEKSKTLNKNQLILIILIIIMAIIIITLIVMLLIFMHMTKKNKKIKHKSSV